MVSLPQPNVDLTVATPSPIDWKSGLNGAAAPAPGEVLLIPGKLTEVTARVKNNSQQALWVSVGVQGDFPESWFTPELPPGQPRNEEPRHGIWRENVELSRQQSLRFGTDYFALQPRETVSINLGFTLPSRFFEDPEALRTEQSAMRSHPTLSYGSEIFLHQTDDPEQSSAVQLIAYKTLQLYPRPERIYQKFLPEFYQESDFLGRFLNITEQSFEPVYETTETFWAYLDPLLTPKALVPFLAHWVAWPMNPSLTLSQQRRLIRHAVEIYQWRGTARGLKLCLHLCTGLEQQQIEVLEPDEREFAIGEITLGDQPSLGGGKAYHFVVILNPDSQEQLASLDETAIRTLIEQEKPAFCTYTLEISPLITPADPTATSTSPTPHHPITPSPPSRR
ncbi:phage tail protein [Leptolyngbya sp. Heron Island J]|uniref:phage tail protein n=1 Tax=Leptolyngbya sp. Heron Island J TaxID=1385935 RepID=UPI0003B98668|nr:phage tail protein [Leptolyngbya sp. Heron Island J]ESA38840.1 phage tail protein [Leptolyngbya sp. Heron Island J]